MGGDHVTFLSTFLARHASEQYNTDSQFLAQALRQVIVRPHTAHSLLGRDCLLPLKSFFIRVQARGSGEQIALRCRGCGFFDFALCRPLGRLR